MGMTDQNKQQEGPLGPDAQEESQGGINKGGLVMFVISMVSSIAVLIYVSFFSGGVDLHEVRETPNEAAVTTAEAEPKATAPVDVSGITEPWLPNEDMVKHGAAVFKMNCAMCHGEKGAGDGVAGGALNPKPRNFVEGKWTHGGKSIELFKTIEGGIPGGSMQAYKDALPAKDRWALVQFIRSITQNLVADNDAELREKAPGLQ